MEGKDYVLPEFFNLDPNIGGHQSLLIGNSGQGKTTLMEYFTMLAVSGKNIYNKNREKQAALWRARKHDRYLDFVNLKIGRLMFPRNSSFLLQKIWPKEDGSSYPNLPLLVKHGQNRLCENGTLDDLYLNVKTMPFLDL